MQVDDWYNMDESQKHYSELKKPDKKEYIYKSLENTKLFYTNRKQISGCVGCPCG